MPKLATVWKNRKLFQTLTRTQHFAVGGLVLLVLLWLVENWVGESFWPVLIVTYLPQQPMIVLPLLLLGVSAWKRDRFAVGISGAALVFFAWSFGGLRTPVFQSASAAWTEGTRLPEPHLRVLTLNLNRGSRGMGGLIRAIRAQNPDVICLQETRRWGASTTLYEEVRAHLPDFVATTTHEVAILSRYPVLKQSVIPLENTGRALLETIIGFRGQRVHLFSIHVTAMNFDALLSARELRAIPFIIDIIEWSNLRRQKQFETLLSSCERTQEPTIVCGDFNTPPRGQLYRRMRSRFTDCFDRAGWGSGNTFTSELPLLRIDYIWSSPHWRVERCFTAGGAASDHQGVVADLVLE